MNSQRKLISLFILLFFATAIKAQEAYKFEETNLLRWDASEIWEVFDFSRELQKLPDANGMVILLGRRGTALKYVKLIRKHLSNSLGINPERISGGYGGDSEKLTLQLWIIPKGAKEPPTISKLDYKKATLVDYYSWGCLYCETERPASLRTFASELKQHPEAEAYIIIYPSKEIDSEIRNRRQAYRQASVEKRVLNKYGVKNSRVITLIGDYSRYDFAELWLVPPGAKPPKPTARK